MPIPRAICKRCPSCGWKAVRTEGDVIFPGDLKLLVRCPSCGADLESVAPTLLDQVNPLNRLRALSRWLR